MPLSTISELGLNVIDRAREVRADVLADGGVVGRIMRAAAVPVGMSWMWTLAYGYHEDRTLIYGYEPTREAAMATFVKSWGGSELFLTLWFKQTKIDGF